MNTIHDRQGCLVYKSDKDPSAMLSDFLKSTSDFRNIDFRQWGSTEDFPTSRVSYRDCVFNELGFFGRRWHNVSFVNCTFVGTMMGSSRFVDTSFSDCCLSKADLRGSLSLNLHFFDSTMTGARVSPDLFNNPDSSPHMGGYIVDNDHAEFVAGSRALLSIAYRSDGYVFKLWRGQDGNLYITAGCRCFKLKDAYHHWRSTRHPSHRIRIEAESILETFRRLCDSIGVPWL